MVEQKAKIAAFILAILSAFLLLGISYVLFPSYSSQQPDPGLKPEPGYLLSELSWAILLLGLAAVVASLVAITVFVLTRNKRNTGP